MGGGGEVISRSESLRLGPSVVFIGLVFLFNLTYERRYLRAQTLTLH